MKFLRSKKDLLQYRDSIATNQSIGFVPTMGALHQGHISLVKESLKENDITIVSVFVNPTQFDNPEDLKKYPNLIEKDQEMLQSVGVDALYYPSVEDMYPNGLEVEEIDLQGLDLTMEGEFRKGHFQGVATIVKRLFEDVRPNNAYFGEKDYQQLKIIQSMVAQTGLKIAVHGMPIIREPNGLAMSSRNLRLSEKQKEDATVIYKTLEQFKKLAPTLSPKELMNKAYFNFAFSPLQLVYCVIADEENLKETTEFLAGKKYRTFFAAYCGEVRLIDNAEIL